ncbi:histone-lysine N-methyltransferase ASHR2 [Arachis stenosperma]|uniref:histone-lysine N-methyltransferase ASHR2 n=1 Tax=Arachis stenosperma TaxID=217475 RepID=UPI0025ACA243|nr:histone-lysine N-methyltransferase ASHR2 [Arachis stenosperma]XP_057748419.1 histone-lysine N-methyltransferase ASHR2 [Arachis stenosperma]XP_057748420.1 histone-lysine N-methyltransferase ASHR2 [Arachis stenosperma]
MSVAAPSSLLKVEEIQGRGRGMVASQPLKAGQIVLRDSPILLYSALPLIPQSLSSSSSTLASSFCDHCFRTLPSSLQGDSSSSAVLCPSCRHYRFCSSNCLSKALNSSHSSWVCQALSHFQANSPLIGHPLELQVQAQFLIAAYNLANISPSDFQILLSLHGSPDDATISAAQFLHPLISSLCSIAPIGLQNVFSLELTSALLAKDKHNAFGLMQPVSVDDGQRSVRAYGIYPYASFFNHDCLPNACRFDYVDSNPPDGSNNTDIIVRMIHDVPQGREICLSYFPVNENYASRQKRLMEDYGFTCNCDRCNVESNWSDNDDTIEEDNAEDGEEVMDEEDQYENMAASDTDNNNDFPHAYFFLRYMCDRPNCGGTLAPLPPQVDSPSNVMECNVCGKLKSDDEQDEAPMED